jgi:hypothetical protein
MDRVTFVSIENVFKMPSIDRRNLRLAIEEVKSTFQVPITSFQCLKGNLLTASDDKRFFDEIQMTKIDYQIYDK